MGRQMRQGLSHASLLRDVSAAPAQRSRRGLDAIVVPAGRTASDLEEAISLSARTSVPLVVLCSRHVTIGQVDQRVRKTRGARALVIAIPEGYQIPGYKPSTSDKMFWEASARRSSDLSVKRNLGLLLGRMRGWTKLLFLDDDIRQVREQDLDRLVSVLDRHPVASMVSRRFPDNSVVCHARRLAGLRQDVFVSGAVLGVNLQQQTLSFFPDIYNEDWFFFARHAARRSLPKIGEVRQAAYHPFAIPWRAKREEFGDLLGEGLYALFEREPGLDLEDHLRVAKQPEYWESFAKVRRDMIEHTETSLRRAEREGDVDPLTIKQALQSLEAAKEQSLVITRELCVEFIESWLKDEDSWQHVLRDETDVLSESEALARCALTEWMPCGYGVGSDT
ncbi:hypothetical protein ACIA49_19675 [Kribbella sp. NPDC051587]|uniref:hypothetical protein n=1 Tax=Kribbella sp. NPDC051587 TaxID=3364119 RepID=UPI0037A17574